MSNSVYDHARQGYLAGDGSVQWSPVPKLKAVLLDMDQAGPNPGGYAISAINNASNPIITTRAAHGLAPGALIAIFGVLGAAGSLNGLFTVSTVPTSTTFSVTAPAPGVYTSGGYVMPLYATFLSELAGPAIVGRSAALTAVTNALGIAGSSTAAFSGVPTILGQPNGMAEAIVFVQAALTFAGADLADTAQRLLYFIDTAVGLPVTPNGGDLNLVPATQGWFRL